MLDPEAFDGVYVGDVNKVVVTDSAVQFLLDFDFNGKKEQIVAEISFVKGLNRTTKMLRESGVKKVDELKNVKKVAFAIQSGWINVTGISDEAGTSCATNTNGAVSTDTSKFLS